MHEAHLFALRGAAFVTHSLWKINRGAQQVGRHPLPGHVPQFLALSLANTRGPQSRMQVYTPSMVDPAVTEPLLGFQWGGSNTCGGSETAAAAPSAKRPPLASQLHFVRRFLALIVLLRPFSALILALLAVGEAVVVAEGGCLHCRLVLLPAK